jgi:CheY-like chemotaxis protein
MENNKMIRKPSPTTVLVDDSYVIRQVFKAIFSNPQIVKEEASIYTSANGLEGLGVIMISKPNIIILDSTLPKYNGRELVEYLTLNSRYQGDNHRIVVTYVNKLETDLPDQYVLVDKSSKDFLKLLISKVDDKFNSKIDFDTFWTKIGRYFATRAIVRDNKRANYSLKIKKRRLGISKIMPKILEITNQFMSRSNLFLVHMTLGRGFDSNLPQEKKDLSKYRSQYTSVLSTFVLTLFFLVFQLALVLSPGLYIFGYKLKSMATLLQDDSYQALNFNSALYEEGIEYENNIYGLKRSVEYLAQNNQEIEYEEENVLRGTDKNIAILSVKGVSTPEPRVYEEIYLDSSNPRIFFNEPIEYSELYSIREESTVNDYESSVSDENGIWMTSQVTYQLSPDGIIWYYFNKNTEKWESVNSGYLSSNNVQEVNKYLDKYQRDVGGQYLYLTAYLNSDGQTPLELYSVAVERKVGLITAVRSQKQPQSFPSVSIEFINSFDEEIELALFSAAYQGGHVTVTGEINNKALEYDGELYVYFYYFNQDTGRNGSLLGRTKLSTDIGDFTYNGLSLENGLINAELILINGSTAERLAYAQELVSIENR